MSIALMNKREGLDKDISKLDFDGFLRCVMSVQIPLKWSLRFLNVECFVQNSDGNKLGRRE